MSSYLAWDDIHSSHASPDVFILNHCLLLVVYWLSIKDEQEDKNKVVIKE
jgi:hypothetical protein